jgi:microcystin-dependent protein
LSNFLGQFPSYSQLPTIDNALIFPGDSAYTLDDGGYWIAKQPSAPPGALPAWLFIDTLRGTPGPTGAPGVGLPGPQGQIGPEGRNGSPGPRGPSGRSSFSYLSVVFRVPDPANTNPQLTSVTDTSWMTPGLLLYIPNAGTFTVVGSPIDGFTFNLVNSGDPNNAPAGTMIAAGTVVSPSNMRGPLGPQGGPGPQGPPGPQGVSGTSAFSTLNQPFSIPTTTGIAFVVDASPFGAGQIVYVEGGEYFSVQAVDEVANTLTLANQNYPGGQPPGTVVPVGNTVSGTGPQGPQGPQGATGPQGTQGIQGVATTGTIAMWGTPTAPGGWILCQGQAVSRTQFSALFSIISTTFGIGDGSSTFNVPNFQGRFPLGGNAAIHPIAQFGGEETHVLTTAELASHAHTMGNHTHVGANHLHDLQNHTHAGADHLHSLQNHTHAYAETTALATTGVVAPAPGPYPYALAPSNISAQTGGPSTPTTGAADRSLTTGGPSPNNTGFADRGLTTAGPSTNTSDATGSGTAHNNMPPFLAINFIIKA